MKKNYWPVKTLANTHKLYFCPCREQQEVSGDVNEWLWKLQISAQWKPAETFWEYAPRAVA